MARHHGGAPALTRMGPDTLFEHAFMEDAGGAAEGTLIIFGGVPPALLDGPGRAFYQRFGLEPECYAASAYDATGVILQAIERAGRLDRAAITEAAFATRDFDACSAAGASTQTGTSTCGAPPG